MTENKKGFQERKKKKKVFKENVYDKKGNLVHHKKEPWQYVQVLKNFCYLWVIL